MGAIVWPGTDVRVRVLRTKQSIPSAGNTITAMLKKRLHVGFRGFGQAGQRRVWCRFSILALPASVASLIRRASKYWTWALFRLSAAVVISKAVSHPVLVAVMDADSVGNVLALSDIDLDAVGALADQQVHAGMRCLLALQGFSEACTRGCEGYAPSS